MSDAISDLPSPTHSASQGVGAQATDGRGSEMRRAPGSVAVGVSGFALALLGWWISIDLWGVSRGADSSNPLVAAQCAGEKNGDCLSVLRSERASIVVLQSASDPRSGFRIPVAALGAAYFSALAAWFLFIGRPARRQWLWHAVLMLVVGIGLFESWNYLSIMSGDLKRWCAGCVAAHAVNGAIGLLTLISFPWKRGGTSEVRHPSLRHGGAVIALGAVLFILHPTIAVLSSSAESAKRMRATYEEVVTDPEYVRWRYERQTPVEIEPRADDVFSGSTGAENTIVVFGDFQCPSCRYAHDQMERLVRERVGQVRLLFRHFPQDSSCNPDFETAGHPFACRAASAVEAARIAGGAEGYRRMKATMYSRQRDIELNRFGAWAEEIGLSREGFEEAISGARAVERVASDVALGKKLGIRAVPVVYLNGRRVEGWSSPGTWDVLLGGATSRSAP